MNNGVPPTIVAIHLVSRRSTRRTVELDSGETFSVDAALLTRFGVRVGMALDAERREKLLAEDTLSRAKAAAFDLLRLRNQSEQEMREKLARKGFPEDAVEHAIGALRKMGYLSDEKFTAEWVESRRRHNPKGLYGLRRELQKKGIDRTTIERTLRTVSDDDERIVALALAKRQMRRYRSLTRDVVQRRLYDFLMRRGFSYEVAYAVLRELSDAGEIDLS
ncbi:hypothetical protein FJZ36_13910 [Candidatus Poribacteria bacterium]|nr:hypothetical protein [Candidatus Poribacteria bacterium]